jgi:diguanylate cyclase (GGDEF)-like protein
MLLVIALCNSAFAGELDFATMAVVEPANAMRYAWISGLCATLALVFTFLWVATGHKAFAWYLGTVLATSWRIGENSGQLPALFPGIGHAQATVPHLLADSVLLFFTVGLLLQALGRQAADLSYRRILYAAGVASLVLAALTPWPMLVTAVLHGGLALAYGVLVLLTAWLAMRGQRVFLWYCMGLLVPLVSMYLQQTLGVGTVLLSSYRMDNALVQGLVVLAGALAYQDMLQRRTHMRELRGLLQEQNLALEKARQAEIDLESQVSQRTQELAMAARRLEALSTVDGMTGVANRRRFDETLQVEWGRAARDKRPLSVALIDVDWFKSYNDRYGHPAGDACLRQLARVFEAGVMRSGDLIARYGGEEFVLIAPDTDLNGINTIASYLCQEVFALALEHEDSPYGRVSVSIGVAMTYPHRGSKPLQLVQQADAALYRAKQQGRHRVAGPEGENENA